MDERHERTPKKSEEIMEKDRKQEKRLKLERLAEAKELADKMFEVAMKSGREKKGTRWCPSHPAYASTDRI